MQRLQSLFQEKKRRLLSVYFTAGFPKLNSTLPILQALEAAGADMVEIGIPFSDPLADGPVIQQSSQYAIQNGMHLPLLFEQLKDLRPQIKLPVLLMGYLNPVLQYGIERFCQTCVAVGVDGVILPDLPADEYQLHYKEIFEQNGIAMIFLATPQTNSERLQQLDQLSRGFLYLVSTASTTGTKNIHQQADVEAYLQKVSQMSLQNPLMVGFGIADHEAFELACRYASGAIVGTAFIRELMQLPNKTEHYEEVCKKFVARIKGGAQYSTTA